MIVDFRSGRCCPVLAESRMLRVGVNVARVPEAPTTDVQPVCVFIDEIFRIDGLIPCWEKEVTQYDVLDVTVGGGGWFGARHRVTGSHWRRGREGGKRSGLVARNEWHQFAAYFFLPSPLMMN